MNLKQSCALFFLFSAANALAAVNKVANDQGVKVNSYAVIDVQKIIMSTGINKEAVQKLSELQQKYQKDLKDMAETVMKLEQELKTKAAMWTPEVIKQKQAEYEEKNSTLQLRLNRANNELREADMKASGEIFQQIQKYVQQTLIDKQGYQLVFERNSIIACAACVDKSDDVIKVVSEDLAKKAKAKEVKKETPVTKNGQVKPVAAEPTAVPSVPAAVKSTPAVL